MLWSSDHELWLSMFDLAIIAMPQSHAYSKNYVITHDYTNIASICMSCHIAPLNYVVILMLESLVLIYCIS